MDTATHVDVGLARRRATAVLQVLSAAALWGVSGVVARSLFRRAVEPSHLVQVRMLLGGLSMIPVAFWMGHRRIERRALPGVLAYSAVLTAVQLTYFEAIAAAGVAVAMFLQYTAPLLVAAWEALRARRLPSRPVLVALSVAVAGSALLVLPRGGVRVPFAGFVWGFASCLSFAAATILAGRLRRRGMEAVPLLTAGLLLGSFLFVPLRTPWNALASITAPEWPFFVYIAVFSTAVPFTLYAASLASLKGSVAMLLAMLEPVLGSTLAWIVLGEALSTLQVGGALLILGAIALAARAR